jgi:hypothetical protein
MNHEMPPRIIHPIVGDFNSYSPQNWGAWGPLWGLGAGASRGAKILFVQEV